MTYKQQLSDVIFTVGANTDRRLMNQWTDLMFDMRMKFVEYARRHPEAFKLHLELKVINEIID